MIAPVFKTGGWQVILSPVGSTPTRFRQFSTTYRHTNQLQISSASAEPCVPPGMNLLHFVRDTTSSYTFIVVRMSP